MCALFIMFITCLVIIAVTFVVDVFLKKRANIVLRHILVTGGSSGIGKDLAIEAFKQGANVTILARNKEQLEKAKKEIEEHAVGKEQKINAISVDLSKDYASVEQAIIKAEEDLGPIDMLVNCAGTSVAYRFEDMPVDEFKRMMDINYFGSVYAARAVVSKMKERRNGRILFVSSLAALFGLYGYSAYSASKYAVRGFAECLQMETKPYNIRITVAYPPDTDTPGFALEEKTKPTETRLISQSAALVPPQTVAKKIFADSLNDQFSSVVGFEGWFLHNLCCGMSPVSSYVDTVIQIFSMGLLRLVGIVYLKHFERIVEKCAWKREEAKVD